MRRERGQHAHGSGNLLAYGGCCSRSDRSLHRPLWWLGSGTSRIWSAHAVVSRSRYAFPLLRRWRSWLVTRTLVTARVSLAVAAGRLGDSGRVASRPNRADQPAPGHDGVGSLVLPTAIAVPIVYARERSLVESLVSLPDDLRKLPGRSVVVTGQLCESIRLAQVIACARCWPGKAHAPSGRPSVPGGLARRFVRTARRRTRSWRYRGPRPAAQFLARRRSAARLAEVSAGSGSTRDAKGSLSGTDQRSH